MRLRRRAVEAPAWGYPNHEPAPAEIRLEDNWPTGTASRPEEARLAALAGDEGDVMAVAGYRPPGRAGPAALRARARLRVPAHRATSDIFSAAYPFLAEAGLGTQGVLVGQDSWSGAAFVFDPWVLYRAEVLTNPNVLVAGQIGRGKSTLAKSLATRSIAFGRRVYVPADPKGEWTVVSRAVGGPGHRAGPGELEPAQPARRGAPAR